jgi:hypothetical protein
MKKKQEEVLVGYGSHLNIQTSHLVTLYDTLTLMDGNRPVELDIKIEADFNDVPEKYHEIFFNVMSARFYGKVSFKNNPFSDCLPPSDKTWWKFWKR